MAEPNLFEEMLATYPAEKRELAREVYHRFADGDSAQFFTQLFLVLDVYAHYTERIPTRMISANADSLATMHEIREEVGLIAKTIETRDVNITNHAEKTDELCRITLAKCNETIIGVELMVKNLGARVDTQAIVKGVEHALNSGIRREVISPFIQRTEELAQQVMPALEKVRAAAAEAKSSWSRRIWKDASGNVIESKGQANRVRLPQVSILPQIGPLQEEERVLDEGYIRRSLASSRSSLHFRNQLHYMRHHFRNFKQLVEETWHGLSLDAVELKELPPADRGASLFVRDMDFSAEVGWMGHGLQMWLQTMWFLTHCAGANSMILDEPDVYMHADLQRRLIRLLRARKHQTIVATHSIEIMSEVEPDEVLVIDRRRAKSYFAGKHPTVQSLLESIGSIHNIQLSRLGASRRFLMVEGDDVDFLKRFQNTLFPDSQIPIDTIPHKSIGGWNGWERAVGCATFLNDEAGESIKPYCLLDSDYQTPDTIQRRQKSAASHGVQLHIWKRKEIENYFLVPTAILRLIQRSIQPTGEKPTLQDVEKKLDEVAERLRMDTFNAMATAFQDEDRSGGVTGANKKAEARLNTVWKQSSGKLTVVCGKEVIHKLSEWSNRKYGVSFNAVKLARELSESEIDEEVKSVLSAIENCDDFKTNKAV